MCGKELWPALTCSACTQVALQVEDSERSARLVKARLERTLLGQVSSRALKYLHAGLAAKRSVTLSGWGTEVTHQLRRHVLHTFGLGGSFEARRLS